MLAPSGRRNIMWNSMRTLAAAAVLATGVASYAGGAAALPIADAPALKNAAPAQVEAVRWYGRGWGWGAPLAGFAAGAIIGGAIAGGAPYYYGPGPYYYGPPAYYGPGYAPPPGYYGAPAAAPAGGNAAAYCAQRFKSYDPASGTYLGFDGQRHPCP
jgi:BA14K-like protein